jgi:hypothetical protein
LNIVVVNIRIKGYVDGATEIYIGRGNRHNHLPTSALANPWHIGVDGNRKEVIVKYRAWLLRQISEGRENVIDELRRLAGLASMVAEVKLACWCAPQPCHGDVIKEYIEQIATGKRLTQ